MNKNLEYYDKLRSVPQQYLKTITAGRLKGMSDIKPQWRILILTEVFGMCGIGWKVANLKFDYKQHGDEVNCVCTLDLHVKVDGEWSDAIPAVGGSKFVTMERNGVYVTDEAEKMAYTDAISVAAKMIGVAGDVYIGHGGKYDAPQPTAQPQPKPNKKVLMNIDSKGEVTPEWNNILKAISEGKIKTIEQIEQYYIVSEHLKGLINDIINF